MKTPSSQNSQQTKLAIFVGDDHSSFSTTQLLANLLQSCEEKGLSVGIFSESLSQELKKGGKEQFDHIEGLSEEKISATCAKVDAKTVYVCNGREEFEESQKTMWQKSGKTPREIMQSQLDNGGVVDEVMKGHMANDMASGTIAGCSPKQLKDWYEKNYSPEKLALFSELENSKNFDFDSPKTLGITLDQFGATMVAGDIHLQLVLPQIREARAGGICDVEIIMFGDSHLASLHDQLKDREYSQSQITALSRGARVIGEGSTHPLKTSGIVQAYDERGSLPPTLEASLVEVSKQKQQEVLPLLKEVREFNQNVKEEDRKLINQFTEQGLDLLVDYYNTKYPDRGQIHRVAAPMVLDLGFSETDSEKNKRVTLETQEAVTQGIADLRANNQSPIKVMLTFLQKETPESDYLVERGRHSVPLVITNDKLIMLRDDTNPLAAETFKAVAQNLGLQFVQQKEPAQYTIQTENGEKIKSTSIQADHSNCNGIALGILKDLTKEDLIRVADFEDGYTPLPKMLKYSQSEGFILKTYPKLANEAVKFNEDGTAKSTLIDYVRDNSRTEDGKKVGTRIGDKMDRMRQDMSELNPQDKGKWTQKILEKRAQAKEFQNEITGR